MRILLVEDEHKIAAAIKKGLELERYAVDVLYDGKEAMGFVTTEAYDLIILDRMLPNIDDGLTLCKVLRAHGIHTPVLILTAMEETEDRITGLDNGADDYLVKPFAMGELLARVRALLRRPRQQLETTLAIEDLQLNTLTFEVTRAGQLIVLSQKEYALLEYLMRHPNQTLSRETIIHHVWDYDADILPNTVEVYIGYLRAKIDKPFPGPRLIHTVRGFGYKFGVS